MAHDGADEGAVAAPTSPKPAAERSCKDDAGATLSLLTPRSQRKGSADVDVQKRLEDVEMRLLAAITAMRREHTAAFSDVQKLAALETRSCDGKLTKLEQRLELLEARMEVLIEAPEASADGLQARLADLEDWRWQKLPELLEAQVSAAVGDAVGSGQLAKASPPGDSSAATSAPDMARVEERLATLEVVGSQRSRDDAERERRDARLAEWVASLEERQKGAAATTTREAVPATSGDKAGKDSKEALRIVQELEAVIHNELTVVHKRCNELQESFDKGLQLPFQQLERQVEERSKAVAQMVAASNELSARVEEHEFRLGVQRTRLEVYDEKMTSMDRLLRQMRSAPPPRGGGAADAAGASSPAGTTVGGVASSPTAATGGGAGPRLAKGFSAASFGGISASSPSATATGFRAKAPSEGLLREGFGTPCAAAAMAASPGLGSRRYLSPSKALEANMHMRKDAVTVAATSSEGA
eukprot:TRINITY_DN34555_c0_g1_i1.p1 TRINITY_DN34555_c0_g1~~TRINITY_DN34555_c0_g1_i1.p1  ORF type:complete len:472 (+),score=146.95 TRINITY_DN34555_c0_g1_i1:71-1486(+)